MDPNILKQMGQPTFVPPRMIGFGMTANAEEDEDASVEELGTNCLFALFF